MSGGPYTLVVEQAQQIQNVKLPPQQLRDNADRPDAAIPGNPDIAARGTVFPFEIVFGKKEGADGSFFGMIPDGVDPDDYALGLTCVNGAADKDQTEEQWWDEHDVLGIAKTMATTNLKGSGTAKDTYPIVKSGKTTHFYTNPHVDCPRNSFMRARIPMTSVDAKGSNVRHQGNSKAPENRFLLYAEPVDLRYVGYTPDSARELRRRFEAQKLEGAYTQAFNASSLEALTRLTAGLKQTFMLMATLMKNRLAAENDAAAVAAAGHMGGVLEFLSRAGDDVISAVDACCMQVVSPHLSDYEGFSTDDRMIARGNMNGFPLLANTLTQWRWKNTRTVFCKTLTAAKSASGRPQDIMAMQNCF